MTSMVAKSRACDRSRGWICHKQLENVCKTDQKSSSGLRWECSFSQAQIGQLSSAHGCNGKRGSETSHAFPVLGQRATSRAESQHRKAQESTHLGPVTL